MGERTALIKLTKMVVISLSRIDKEMKKPSTVERGRNIAKICNDLDLVNDSTMRFDLGYGWKAIKNIKQLQ